MTSSSVVNCDLCDRDHVTKPANGYCPQCDDALCIDCKKYHKLSKATKSHDTITVEEFQRLPSFVRKIKQTCEEHGDLLEFFCPIHDKLYCKLCLHFVHKNCNEVVFIPEMVKTTDLSSQLDNFLKTTEDVERNIKLAITDRQNNLADIEQHRKDIINEVKRKKEEIINYLDKIEEELLKSLLVTYKNIKLKNEKLVNDMLRRCEETVDLKEEIAALKRNASGVQLFIGSRELMKPVASLKQYVKATLENGSLDRTSLVLATNEQINNITDNISSFATVSNTYNPSTVRFEWKEEQSAQIMTLKKRNFVDIHLKLKMKLDMGNVNACIVLSDGNIIVGMPHYRLRKFEADVMKYTSKGQLISELLIEGTQSYDILSVNENTVAVTSGDVGHSIHIIDVNTFKVVKVIECDDCNYGATFYDGSLICCTHSHGIRGIDIEKEKRTTIVAGKSSYTHIVSDNNYLYHSNCHNDSAVVCYDFNGSTKWTYKSELLKSPQGITIDRDSNVYVAGYKSNNVVVISSNGKQGRQLLGPDDGICNPISININKERNILLVGNQRGSLYLYDLKI